MPSTFVIIENVAVSANGSLKFPAVRLLTNKGSPPESKAPNIVCPKGTEPHETRSGINVRIINAEPDVVWFCKSMIAKLPPVSSFTPAPTLEVQDSLKMPTSAAAGTSKRSSLMSFPSLSTVLLGFASNSALSELTPTTLAVEPTPVRSYKAAVYIDVYELAKFVFR